MSKNTETLKQEADNGDVSSMCAYAKLLYDENRKEESARYFKMSADRGQVKSMLNYANMRSKGDGISVDKTESAFYYKKAADLGEVNSMFYYGQMLYRGDGVSIDKEESAKYFKQSADSGKRDGMHNYAMMVLKGDGIQSDKKEAAKYFKMAADKGQIQSMYNYASMASKGDGVEQNEKEAKKYFKMAADKGSIQSMHRYASIEAKSDKKESAKYFKMAADKGQIQSMFAYASLLSNGEGVDEDKNEAVKYFKLAADRGMSQAKRKLNELKNLGFGSKYLNDHQTPNLFQSLKATHEPEILKPDQGKPSRSHRSFTGTFPNHQKQRTIEKLPKINDNQQPKSPENQTKFDEKLPSLHTNQANEAKKKEIKMPEQLQEINDVQTKSPRNQRKQANNNDGYDFENNETEEKVDIEYDHTESGRFKGIIHLLTEKVGGNVHNEGIVNVTSSSVYKSHPFLPFLPFFDDDDYSPYNCVDLEDTKSCFESDNKPNSWICYDFQELKVNPNMYSIRTYVNGNNHIQTWVIEGSNDKENWTILDEKENERSINGIGKSNSFTLRYKNNKFYRYLRLKQTGRSTGGGNILNVSALEFFGSIAGAISSISTKKENADATSNYITIDGISNEPFEIKYDGTEEGRFKGIIHYLTEKCGGNVHKKGVVEVTSSSVVPTLSFLQFEGDEDYNPYNCVDLENKESCFESDDEPNSWICYDFQNIKVIPKCYSIRSNLDGNNHIQTWIIEGSNDKENWETLDSRRNETSLSESGKSSTFKIHSSKSGIEYYRYLRLKQTEATTMNSNIMSISALEFFGSIFSGEKPSQPKGSSSSPRRHRINLSSSSFSDSSDSEHVELETIEVIENPIDLSYDHTEAGLFKGIIQHLTEKCGGNVHLEGIVNITSSSVIPSTNSSLILQILDEDEDYNPYNCADFEDTKSCFESANEKNSWICYDFRKLKVSPNMYSIRSYLNGDNHLQTWVIEGSKNKKDWTILDERKEDNSLDEAGKANIFRMKNIKSEVYYRYLRLRQTGKSTINSNVISISAIEFFGTIVGKITQGPKQQRKKKRSEKIPEPNPRRQQSRRHKHHKHHKHHHHKHRRNSSSSSSSSSSTSSSDFYSFESNPIEDVSNEPFEIKYDGTEEGRFKGIIHYLTEKCGGNVHKKGVVEVTSSSVFSSLSFLLSEKDDDYNPYNAVDLENKESCFESSNEKNSWICYDFKNLKVRPKCYSIRTYINGNNHLKSWCIEGSNDRLKWIVLDERINENSLNDIGKSNTFEMNMNIDDDEYFRFLRLRQISNTEEINILNISALDYFGFLYCRIFVA